MNTLAASDMPQTSQWLSFHIGPQIYAAPLAEVSEVIRDGELTPVPGAAADMLGVRHLRGRIVPVMDGRQRLGLSGLPAADPVEVRIVMLAHDGHPMGLRVDAIGELLDTAGKEIAPPPSGRQARADDPVSGVLAWREGFIAMLDLRRLCRVDRENA